MKSLKTILGIALSVGGLGTAATVTGVSIAQADRAVVDSVVEAWSGSECGTTWYIIGTINGQNWNSWNKLELNNNNSRYEYTFEDNGQVEFKLKNANSWDSGIEINSGYGNDLDWSGKGWTSLTNKKDGGNFQTKKGGMYTVYFDKNISSYGNGVWAFGIEEKVDPSASTNSFYVYDPHSVLGSTFANIKVYGFGEATTIKPMSWPGTHSGISQTTLGRTSMYQVALSVSYPNFVMNCGDKQNQTVDVTNLSSNIGNVLVIDNTQTSGKYNVHWDNPEVYSDVPATDGYYLLGDDDFVTATGGSGTSWKYATGVKMNTLSGEENKANYVLTVNRSVKFRARSYLNSTNSWLSFGTTYDGTDGITTSGDNVQVVAGTYSIYVNKDSLVYVAKGIPLDAFCSTFLTDVANTCDAQTGNTDPDTLHTLWGDLATLYNGVTADGKAEIVAITFNGGSDADDPHKVVKAYHYIVTKYGTTVCPDFIWGQSYNPASANKVSTNNSTNNSASAIIAASAAISLTAVGVFFILRKKKEN